MSCYFSDREMFQKTDIKVRVGIKEVDDPIPLCYCFGYTRENVRTDIEGRGSTEIPDRIKAEIQGGFCAGEVKNPSGDCCLGNGMKAIQDVQNKLAHAANHEAKSWRGRIISTNWELLVPLLRPRVVWV